jgi:hypothetical protein
VTQTFQTNDFNNKDSDVHDEKSERPSGTDLAEKVISQRKSPDFSSQRLCQSAPDAFSAGEAMPITVRGNPLSSGVTVEMQTR